MTVDKKVIQVSEKPTRCIDPVMKYCQECPWGWVSYPTSVDAYGDLDGCSFESGCSLGYDRGRPEDEPTEEEVRQFEQWWEEVQSRDGS